LSLAGVALSRRKAAVASVVAPDSTPVSAPAKTVAE